MMIEGWCFPYLVFPLPGVSPTWSNNQMFSGGYLSAKVERGGRWGGLFYQAEACA